MKLVTAELAAKGGEKVAAFCAADGESSLLNRRCLNYFVLERQVSQIEFAQKFAQDDETELTADAFLLGSVPPLYSRPAFFFFYMTKTCFYKYENRENLHFGSS